MRLATSLSGQISRFSFLFTFCFFLTFLQFLFAYSSSFSSSFFYTLFHSTTKQLGVLSLSTTCFWLLAASRLATIFSVLVKADSMSALSLSLPARGLSRCSSVVSRDVVTGDGLEPVVAEPAETVPLLLLSPAPEFEVGCSMNNCGLNNVVDTVVPVVAGELELVTALGCTGEDGSSGMAVREGVEALLT